METKDEHGRWIEGDDRMVQRKSLGEGIHRKVTKCLVDAEDEIDTERFKHVKNGVVVECGTRIFNSANISLGESVYIGHDCFIDGYHEGQGLDIGDNCWIGPGCYIHAAGGIKIGKNTGIGPHVKMLTSYHGMRQTGKPVIENELAFRSIEIGENCDIGVGVMLMPGAKIANDCIVEAGVVIKEDFSQWDMRIIKNMNGVVDHRQLRR